MDIYYVFPNRTVRIISDREPGGNAAEGAAALTDKESIGFRLQFGADCKPGLYGLDFVGA